MLTGIHLSLQESGPFLFHRGEGVSAGPAETGWTVGLPQEPTGAGRSTTVPEVSAEVSGSTIMPQDARGASLSTWEQGAGLKWPHLDEVE